MTTRQIDGLKLALAHGDPNDELAAAWLVALDLMAAYANGQEGDVGLPDAQEPVVLLVAGDDDPSAPHPVRPSTAFPTAINPWTVQHR